MQLLLEQEYLGMETVWYQIQVSACGFCYSFRLIIQISETLTLRKFHQHQTITHKSNCKLNRNPFWFLLFELPIYSLFSQTFLFLFIQYIPMKMTLYDISQLIAQIQYMKKPISPPSKIEYPIINKFNYLSQPASSLPDLLNSDFRILSFSISEHGRTGVFMIETDQGAFVMKSSNEGPRDQFFNRLAGMLSLSVPLSICLCCSEPLFQKIMFEIERFCERDECLYERIKTKLDFPFYQILQYIPSVSLAEIGRERFQKYLLAPNKLYSLGMCLGFDILINNSDRFRLLWSSNGNINNILVQIEDHDSHKLQWIKDRSNTDIKLGNFMYIDHEGYLLDLKNSIAAANFEKYMVKANDFLVKTLRALSEEKQMPQEFQKLQKQIEFYSHYHLSDYDLRTISQGIIYIVKKFLEIYESKAIDELHSNLKKTPEVKGSKEKEVEGSYWYSYWNSELGKVKLTYLQEVYNKVAAVFTTYPQAVEQIMDKLGDIDELVANQKFNDLNEILDVKGSIASKKSIKSRPSSMLEAPFQTENTLLIDPSKNTIEPENNQPSKEEIIPQKQSQQKQNVYEIQQPLPEGQIEASPINKQRKWRQKLQKYRDQNIGLH